MAGADAERGDAGGADDHGSGERAERASGHDEERRGRDEDRDRGPDEELGALLVDLHGRLAHDGLDAVCLAVADGHGHEPASGDHQLQAHDDREGAAGEPLPLDGDGDRGGDERDDEGQPERHVDDGGVERYGLHLDLLGRGGPGNAPSLASGRGPAPSDR
ncbi:MAG: hypothetical protein QM704_26630 [Anaeromyxobacteraceae bacterium]